MIDVKFADTTNRAYKFHPIQKAVNVEGSYKQKQIEKHGRETFVDCPGIFDYKSQGWIMTMWDEFKIYASDNATMAYAGSQSRPADTPLPTNGKRTGDPTSMSADITDGIPIETECPVKRLQPLHFQSPWKIETDKDISLLLLPPIYHSNIVDDILIYPGVVDYSPTFGTINLICSPRRKGVFTIKAGTPILHIIPMVKREYNAVCGPTNSGLYGAIASAKNFYRKYVMKRSKYNLETVNEK